MVRSFRGSGPETHPRTTTITAADAALCSLLAYHTQADKSRIDRLFRLSGLYRSKWDRPTAGSTYGSLTIQAVLGGPYR
jgi:primase-polymerase (primpol)-like protein